MYYLQIDSLAIYITVNKGAITKRALFFAYDRLHK